MVSNEIILCPFCDNLYPFNEFFIFPPDDRKQNIGNGNTFYFDINDTFDVLDNKKNLSNIYKIIITRCPYCSEERLEIHRGIAGLHSFATMPDSHLNTQIRPKSIHKTFPDYVPKAVYEDYKEACAILKFSPKAAATLARRALEGMILDFWQITAKSKGNLKKEIDELQGKVPANQWKAIDAVRRVGNIGAHMEKDVNVIVDIDPGEAEKLISLIELLIQQWYIARHEQEQLYNDIVGIDNKKQEERKNADNMSAQN